MVEPGFLFRFSHLYLFEPDSMMFMPKHFQGSELEAERRFIHATRHREKTLEQKAREYWEVLRLETELAKQRMIAALKRGKSR
jgi:hypothetical protein